MSRQASLVIDEVSPQELRVAGELDRTTADRFDDAVLSVIVGTGPLVLDLSRVRFLDSSGVRWSSSACRCEGGRSCFVSLPRR